LEEKSKQTNESKVMKELEKKSKQTNEGSFNMELVSIVKSDHKRMAKMMAGQLDAIGLIEASL
jgi:hypothetical protein